MPKKFVILGYLIFIFIVLFLYFYWQFLPTQKINASQKVIIHKGEGVKEIAQKLEELGLIKNKNIFQIYVYLTGLRAKFWPGEYNFRAKMSLREIIKELTAQRFAKEIMITFPEGWTSKEMAVHLEAADLVKKEDFLAMVNSSDKFISLFDFLQDKPEKASLEGYLFPDTYRFYLDTIPEEIVTKMLNNFAAKFTPEMRVEVEKQKKNIFEIITMASLLEKEASDNKEMTLIADVFWRRLANLKPLQSCATINYILGTSKRVLSIEETRAPSPYNTYLQPGLPPGPINNPGLDSMKAALWPKENSYWFFLATKERQTIFSQTKEEHDAAKQKYLK